MIIGTAGHIDHGKSALVAALTGVQTDRLHEEKKRGITIELGYAYSPTPDGDILGFVDAPGHEKLVHTMVAGASGIDFGLLIVAADDGVMPQTREHLAILQLLNLRQGAVVITKADRASAARILQVQSDIQECVRGTFLEQESVFVVCALAPESEGIQALLKHLYARAQHTTQRSRQGYFRMAIDRVFSLRGHGTVVAGTIHSGTVTVGSSPHLRLMPSAAKVRIRSIHAQNQASEQAHAGQRCALNLAGTDAGVISRGNWLADERLFTPSHRIDVELRLLPGAERLMQTWSPWHVHLGAAHYVAHAVPLEDTRLASEQTIRVQLVFTEPVCSIAGDPFILRNAQAKETAGGGRVLDPNAPDRKRRSSIRLARLDAIAQFLNGAGLAPLLQQARFGLSQDEIERLHAGPISGLVLPQNAVWLQADHDPSLRWLFWAEQLDSLEHQIEQTLEHFHGHAPDEPGIASGRLRRMCAPSMPEVLWRSLLQDMLAKARLAQKGNWLHQPGHRVSLSSEDQALASRVLPLARQGGLEPPWVRDLAQALDAPEERVRHLMRSLVRKGELFQVVHDLFYHRYTIAQLAELIARLGTGQGISAAQFRDATGLGRKRAIQILEFFNRVGYTRRLRDRHVLRGEPWQDAEAL